MADLAATLRQAADQAAALAATLHALASQAATPPAEPVTGGVA